MGLQVIGAGFGRTGTMSLKSALETLGYSKTHHMEEVLPDARQRRLWHDVAVGLPPDWDAIFDGFAASVDFPSSTYYAELLAHFPDAKVVLSVRNPDRWYKSASETIYAISKSSPLWARRFVTPLRHLHEMVEGTVWQRVFQGRFEEKAYATQVFRDYVEQVKVIVPADKLLIFEARQGWEPLCAFLGKPVPPIPFPHVNDSAAFKQRIRIIRAMFFAVHAVAAAGAVALLWWALH